MKQDDDVINADLINSTLYPFPFFPIFSSAGFR